MSDGWIKLYRSLLPSPAWRLTTPKQKAVLVTIMLMANYEAQQWIWKGQPFEVQPGQLITSLANLAQVAGVTVQSVRSAIDRLEKIGFLKNKSTKTGRMITIINWCTYQGTNIEANKELIKEPTKNQQTTQHLTISKKKEVRT